MSRGYGTTRGIDNIMTRARLAKSEFAVRHFSRRKIAIARPVQSGRRNRVTPVLALPARQHRYVRARGVIMEIDHASRNNNVPGERVNSPCDHKRRFADDARRERVQ